MHCRNYLESVFFTGNKKLPNEAEKHAYAYGIMWWMILSLVVNCMSIRFPCRCNKCHESKKILEKHNEKWYVCKVLCGWVCSCPVYQLAHQLTYELYRKQTFWPLYAAVFIILLWLHCLYFRSWGPLYCIVAETSVFKSLETIHRLVCELIPDKKWHYSLQREGKGRGRKHANQLSNIAHFHPLCREVLWVHFCISCLKHEYVGLIQLWKLCSFSPLILSAYISESITHPATSGIFPLSSLFRVCVSFLPWLAFTSYTCVVFVCTSLTVLRTWAAW